jgi:hypothetical protein
MGIFVAGFICLLTAMVQLVPADLNKIPAEILEFMHALVPVLIVYLMAEGALLIGRNRALKNRGRGEELLVKVRKLEAEQDEDRIKLAELAEEQRLLTEQKAALQTALTEAKARLQESTPLLSGAAREALIDAEIVNLLSLLQEKGRFIDFLMDDIASYQDAQVGAAARVVHQGCASVLKEFFEILPIHDGREGQSVTLGEGYPSGQYRLVGKVKGVPPFQGALLHHGWRTACVKLPRIVTTAGQTRDQSIIAPAEVEITQPPLL